MRLLFVGTSAGTRGTELHMRDLARACAGAGHDVFAVAREGTFLWRELAAAGVPTVHGVFRNAADPRGLSAVLRAASRFRADWILGGFGREYAPLALARKLAGVKLALFRHLPGALKPLTVRVLPQACDRFVAVSRFIRDRLVASGWPAGRLQILDNPIDTDRFRPDPALRAATRERLGLRDDQVVVGFVGFMDEAKGAFRLAAAIDRAMERAPHLRALWVGEPHADLLRHVGAARRERHVLHGWTADPHPLYVAMDVLALPSEWEDPFPRVSLEAQSCGLPVLASDRGGIPETLVAGETGRLLPAGDVPAWERAILELASDPGARAAMGARGREVASARFSFPHVAAGLERLLVGSPA